MYKLMFLVLAALVAFVAAKPWGGIAYASPLAYSYGSPLAYSHGARLAYSAPVAYSAYSSPLAYSGFTPYATAPVAYAASPYSYYYKR